MKDTKTLKWIHKNCGKQIVGSAALIALNAYVGICTTLFAVYSKTVLDAAQNGDSKGLLKNAFVFLILIATQMVSRVAASVIEAVCQGKAEIALKTFVFSGLLYGDYAEVKKRHSGDIMTRLTADVSVVSDNYIHILPTAASYIVRIISSVAVLLTLDKNFAIIFIICGAVLSVCAVFMRKPLKEMHRKVQERDGKVRSFMQEMTENLFAVKVFGIEEKVIKRSKRLQKKLYKEKIKRKTFSVAATIGFSIAFAVGFLSAVAYGSFGILNGTMTFGTVVALIQLVNQLQSPVMRISGVLPSFFAMLSSAQRLEETADCDKAYGTSQMQGENLLSICIKNVTFSYGEDDILENLSFKIEKGDFVGIKGPSGIGKSTVFKLITGLYKPQKGSIILETECGTFSPDKNSRKLFSVVPQGNMLFSGTVRDNITMLSPDADDEKIKSAVYNACAEFVYDLPNGLDTVLGESGAGISEGQGQRIAIARALLGSGKVLLMDESTSALDGETEKRLIENLKKIDGITVIFITHRETVLNSCEKTIDFTK